MDVPADLVSDERALCTPETRPDEHGISGGMPLDNRDCAGKHQFKVGTRHLEPELCLCRLHFRKIDVRED